MRKIILFVIVTAFAISCSTGDSPDNTPKVLISKITTTGSPMDDFNSPYTYEFTYDSNRRFKRIDVESVHGSRWYDFTYYGNGKMKKATVHYLGGGTNTHEFSYDGSDVSEWIWNGEQWDPKAYILDADGDVVSQANGVHWNREDTNGAFANVKTNIDIFFMYLDYNAALFMGRKPLQSLLIETLPERNVNIVNAFNPDGYVIDSFVDGGISADHAIHYEYVVL